MRKALVSICIACYPRDWRARYGEELRALSEDVNASYRDVWDLVVGAAREWRRELRSRGAGGFEMMVGPAWRHPTAWAFTALAMLAPTLAFVIGSLLAYQVGVPGLAGRLDPILGAVNAWSPVNAFLGIAPAIAFVVAALPLVRIGLRRDESVSEAVLAIRARPLNLAVAALAVGLGLLLVAYILSEALHEARV